MRLPREKFSVPMAVFSEPMPAKRFKLLLFLFRKSNFEGKCKPGYKAMRQAIRDRQDESGSDATVRRQLQHLQQDGWISLRKTKGKLEISLRIPLRLRTTDI